MQVGQYFENHRMEFSILQKNMISRKLQIPWHSVVNTLKKQNSNRIAQTKYSLVGSLSQRNLLMDKYTLLP